MSARHESSQPTDVSSYIPAKWTIDALEDAGYVGFLTFAEIRTFGATSAPGVYAVLREPAVPPRFLDRSPAGKSCDFTAPVAALEHAWVPGAEVLYIGKATIGARRDGIHRRLKQYRRTGAGAADNHGGGVWVFQLEDAARLRVCWRSAQNAMDEFVGALEACLLADFTSRPEHGKRPFANRTG